MRTSVSCIPCFFRQLLEAARVAGADPALQQEMLLEFAQLLPSLSLDVSPPEIARSLYAMVRRKTGRSDPYREIKKESNVSALAIYPHLRRRVAASRDRLLKAVELAIAGNVIDYGIVKRFNLDHEVNNIVAVDGGRANAEGDERIHYREFRDMVNKARDILYVADNAGETVFDRILIEELKNSDPRRTITYAVRSVPIINDALMEDALMCGIGELATVIASGSDAPGTILSLCTEEFLECYRSADLVISKGQGNFETLSEEQRPIFFLLKAKCDVVAQHIGYSVGDSLLLSSDTVRTRGVGAP